MIDVNKLKPGMYGVEKTAGVDTHGPDIYFKVIRVTANIDAEVKVNIPLDRTFGYILDPEKNIRTIHIYNKERGPVPAQHLVSKLEGLVNVGE
jgi:hypothetical protein